MTRALYTLSNGDQKADSTLYCEQKRRERRKQNETGHFGISSIAETGNLDGENVLCAVLEYFRNMQKANTTYPSLSIPESTTFYVSYWVMSGANCFACLCTVSIETVWYRTVDPSLVALLYGSCRIYFASL